MFRNLISSLILFVLVFGGGILGYVYYKRTQNSEYSCEKVADLFVRLLQNPTDTITQNEKNTLKSITQSGFVESVQLEQLVLKLREQAKQYTLTRGAIQSVMNSTVYTSSKVDFVSKEVVRPSFAITLQMETIEERYASVNFGSRCSIYKIDTPENITNLDTSLQTLLGELVTEKTKDIQTEGGKIIDGILQNISK